MEPFTVSVRCIARSDYAAAAAIWRDVPDVRNATEEQVPQVYEQMASNDRYCTFVAEADGKVVGLASGIRREKAHDFYEHPGYRKTSYWFRKNLQGE